MRHSRSVWVLLCVVAVLAAGCRKKSSAEFYDAQGRHTVLVAQLGDDAYSDPAMQQVVDLLKRVPPNAREADKAAALLATITSETERVKRDADARARALANAALPSTGGPALGTGSRPLQGAQNAGPEADGGSGFAQPFAGMKESEFSAKFGPCMEPGQPVAVPGVRDGGTMYLVLEAPDCQKKYGTAGGRMGFVFGDGIMQGTMVQTQTKQTVIVDAGRQITGVEVIDGGTTVVWPGMPLPGYDAGP